MLMEEQSELEDGEIEDLSETESFEEVVVKPLVTNRSNFHRTPNFRNRNRHHSFESWRQRKNKPGFRRNSQPDPRKHEWEKPSKKTTDDTSNYDMDDYELLLARHYLIQQQLQKVSSEGLTRDSKPVSNKKNKKTNKKANHSSAILVNEEPQRCENQVEEQRCHHADSADEDELMMLRNALLAQTGKSKKDTVKSEATLESDVQVTQKENGNKKLNNNLVSGVYNVNKTVEDRIINEGNNISEKWKLPQTNVCVLVEKINPDTILSVQTDSISKPSLPSLSKSQTKKLRRRTKQQHSNISNEIPRTIQTRSQAARFSDRRDASVRSEKRKNITSSTKKRRRGGRRAKYLAYRAQQKIETEMELEILKQQQQQVDNYSTVPMDIEDEDTAGLSDGKAPLPLIETTEMIPPPPPVTEGFQPVLDQTALSMTNSNVLWMPGYVESLDSMAQPSVHQETVVSKREKNETKEKASEDTDEIDIWALRAQALKSLACKRAAKAKQTNKPKISTSPEGKPIQQVEYSTTPILPTPAIKPSSPFPVITKINNYIAPPQHPPVIIKLSKEDFEPDEDTLRKRNDIMQHQSLRSILREKSDQAKKRRKSVGDDTLLKELQSIAEKASQKMKKHSSYIVKDQLEYKRLQSAISEKRMLFEKQSLEVKQLQEKLQLATKEKAATRRVHNKFYSQIKEVKDQLKEKIALKKMTDEEILRARSIVSVNRLKLNGKGTITEKMKENISTLVRSLQTSHQQLTKYERLNESTQSSQDESDFSAGQPVSRSAKLMETAANVKKMTKQDLTILELQLREQLNKYRAASMGSTTQTLSKSVKSTDNKETSSQLSLLSLPRIKSSKDLKELQERLSKSLSISGPRRCCNSTLQESLQWKKNASILKTLKISGTQPKSFTADVDGFCSDGKKLLTKYKSVLLRFRSYRLSPYFRTQSKLSIQSPTFSHLIDPKKIMCKFDLLGTCNDNKCFYWHFKEKCQLSSDDIIKDLVAYDFRSFNATVEMSGEKKRKLLESFTKQFTDHYSGKMSSDEKLLLLWNQLKETRHSRKETVYECITFNKRDWLTPNKNASINFSVSDQQAVEQYTANNPVYHLKKKKKKTEESNVGETAESQEVRYFSSQYDSTKVLKAGLAENPSDVKLWLALANQLLKRTIKTQDQDENENLATGSSEEALSVLSQGLEENRDSEDLWIPYLHLFATNSTSSELRELCYQAVMYAATYNVWWTCLNLETTHLGKQEICTEMIKFIVESEEDRNTKSHYLLETVLYAAQLLTCRGKIATAITYLSAALSRDEVVDDAEKLDMRGVRSYLTSLDQSVLWLCFISLQVFHCLPSCLFKAEENAPGRLVCKEKFLLQWDAKPWNLQEAKIRELYEAALQPEAETCVTPLKTSMMLYENLIAFELFLGNVKSAVTRMRTLLSEKPSFVEGWVLLLSLYIHRSPMDAVVTVAEDAIHRCEHDVEIVYVYTNWLYKQGMPSLALEKLTKCIHVYFQFDENDEVLPDVLHLYRKVLGLPVPYTISLPTYLPSLQSSQHLVYYYWSCYCLLLKIKKVAPSMLTFASATDEAYESAVHQYTSLENMKKLWMAYIEHKIHTVSQMASVSVKDYEELEELLFRSLSCVRSSVLVPFNKSLTWEDFSFHNKMLELCLMVIPIENHSKIFRKAINLMPDNVELAIRICQHEMRTENYEQARIVCGSVLSSNTRCLNLWRTAIQVELKCNCIKEARWLYQEATKSLPLCSHLWKDYASFEIIHSATVKLDEILSDIVRSASEHGVELKEMLGSYAVR
ncbi:zinc finger C3H1 domain-containing protein-like isoform X2 [Hydractinia symbiolongicarpus]|uniref:zinc finger C3H1 domain-containing protein-like isoform X2 n=1 Tax=Hydractinia symbiolongicarpus TaxID=13093 RepID=UPI00254E80B1|nr:zinc finger C3H1 domain-containing protein-like isoform X2 [Hydractinia symbiolongicarpus]